MTNVPTVVALADWSTKPVRRPNACSGPSARSRWGGAALSGWTAVLRPALGEGARLWPFDGALEKLLQKAGCVIAETYLADAVRLLNLEPPSRRGGKRGPRYRR